MLYERVEPVPDTANRTMELVKAKNGRYFSPEMVLSTIDSLSTLPLRENDVMLCSYPKSGCHWLWETIRYLLLGESDVHSKIDKEACMIELNTREQLEALESPRVLNNHGFFEDQPEDLLSKGVKVVMVYRNIKDVAVSYYHHHTRDNIYKYKGTFSQYLKRFIPGLVDSGCIFDYLKSWEAGIQAHPELNIHLLSYEDMKESPLQELRRLDQFLGTNRDDAFLQMVALETRLQVMKMKKGQATPYVDDLGSPIMYRKGQVGDWENHFTDEERNNMDDIISKQLGHIRLFTFKDTITTSSDRPEEREDKLIGRREMSRSS